MAQPSSLLGQARAFARDFPRDQMPRGYLWDVVDYVPLIIDAGLTGRGGWQWGSSLMGGDVLGGILASFPSGDKLLTVNADGRWYEVDQTPPYNAVSKGTAYTIKQHPVQFVDTVVAFDGSGVAVPQLITAPGGVFTPGAMHASAPHAPFGTIYHAMAVAGGTESEPNIVRFGYPNNFLAAWDPLSNQPTNGRITALGALRALVLVFHAGSVERIRGTHPPITGVTDGDLINETVFDRVGCTQPFSIAYWNDNCVFADEHGVHITDGAVIRNLASQGGILYFWRQLYGGMTSIAATTFLDYYIVTVRRIDGSSWTLICDLNRRQWFRFANVYSLSYIASSGGIGMERVWASMAGTKRLGRIGPCFFPTLGGALISDDDGQYVLPSFETPWYRLGREGRKRARFGYLSYDVRSNNTREGGEPSPWRAGDDFTEDVLPLVPPAILNTISPVLEVDYVTGPSDITYTSMGGLPPTDDYTRYKLPVWRAPYGIAFRVKQTQPSTVTRIYDLAVEGDPFEPSRL
jgi:hypothetical protein